MQHASRSSAPDRTLDSGDARDQELLYQRVNAIRTAILGRANVARLVVEHGFVDSTASAQERENAMVAFVDAAVIEFENMSVVNQYTGKLGLLPLGIRVSFTSDTPLQAQTVAADLVAQVLDENQGRDDSSGEERNRFLRLELDRASERLATAESRMAEFRKRHALTLPELYSGKVSRLTDVETEITRTEEQIAELRTSAASVRAELATSSAEALMFAADGTRIESAREQLQRLQVEFAGVRTRYSSVHPEYQRLSQQIDALRTHVGDDDTARLEVSLLELQARLATDRGRYAPDHPDILALERAVQSATALLETARGKLHPAESSIPSSPAYNRLLIRQQTVTKDLSSARRRLVALTREARAVRQDLQVMPGVEQQLASLGRLQAREAQTYTDLEKRLSSAEINQELLQADLLGNLVVMEPPEVPLTPESPRRKLLAALLLVLAIGAATLMSIVSFRLGDRIWRGADIRSLTDTPVIAIAGAGA